MGRRNWGKLIYEDFARINPTYLKTKRNLKQIINYFFMLILYIIGGIFLVILSLEYPKLTPSIPLIASQILYLVMLIMLSITAIGIFIELQRPLSERFHNPDPDIYEHGIYLQPGYYGFRFFYRARRFIPFSDIEKIIINPPEDRVIDRAIKITDKEVEDYFKYFPDEKAPIEAVFKEFLEDTIWEINNTIYIMMKNGKRYEYWKKEMKDIDKFKNILKDRGVKVI